MKNKFCSYGFWTALSGAIVVLVEALGKAFGFSINSDIVSSIVMGIAGVLVVFGVVSMPTKEDSDKKDDDKSDEDKKE